MLLLLQRPTLIESILGGRVKWEAAVEEFLRLESPVRGTWRIAARDSELGGVPIPKGKMVFLNFGAANRDANQFPDPRSEEHTSELQSLMRISYDVFCLKKTRPQEH